MRRRFPSVVVLALALLGGCAASGVAPVAPESGRDAHARLAREAAAGTLGAGTAGLENLRIVGTYTAASGRLCRRLADRRGIVLARTSCRRADGAWTLGRALGERRPGGADADGHRPSLAEPGAPAAGAGVVVPVEPAGDDDADGAGDLVHDRLHGGETLWAFAARMTGDPRNYRRIARLNGIDDPLLVASGRSLAVPASIASLAR